MPQLFPRWTNKIPLLIGLGAPLALGGAVFVVWYWFSPSYTDVGYQPQQPVAFSHQLHAGQLGMDCRFCHNTVERAAHAAIPPTQTCMGCHQKLILPDAPRLTPVRVAYNTGDPIPWTRVHMLPNYAYFDHSVHLAAGVGCSTCHGRIDHMKVVAQDQPLSMAWCLDCHKNPAPNLRPRDQLTNMAWDAKKAAYDPAKDTSRKRPVSALKPPLHCSGCHR